MWFWITNSIWYNYFREHITNDQMDFNTNVSETPEPQEWLLIGLVFGFYLVSSVPHKSKTQAIASSCLFHSKTNWPKHQSVGHWGWKWFFAVKFTGKMPAFFIFQAFGSFCINAKRSELRDAASIYWKNIWQWRFVVFFWQVCLLVPHFINHFLCIAIFNCFSLRELMWQEKTY